MAKRKAINFDLSTKELKKYFDNTAQAYNQIKLHSCNHKIL